MDQTYIYGLYDPRNPDLIRYIGKANNPDKRLREHLGTRGLRVKSKKNSWIKSLLNQGVVPIIKVLEVVPLEKWEEAECRWVKEQRGLYPESLTNGTDGGMGGVNPIEETRRKISESNKGKILSEEARRALSLSLKGRVAPNRGKTTPIEVRRKMSMSRKGQRLSEETKKKLSIAHTGKVNSAETRRKISEGNKGISRNKGNSYNKGRIVSEETKRKLSEINKGRVPWIKGKKHSIEARQKMSLSQRGKIMPLETRLKIAIAMRNIPHKRGWHHSEESKQKIRDARIRTIQLKKEQGVNTNSSANS